MLQSFFLALQHLLFFQEKPCLILKYEYLVYFIQIC